MSQTAAKRRYQREFHERVDITVDDAQLVIFIDMANERTGKYGTYEIPYETQDALDLAAHEMSKELVFRKFVLMDTEYF